MMAKKKPWLVIVGVVLVVLIMNQEPKETKKSAACNSANCIDFANTIGTQQMYFGANENANLDDFIQKPQLQQYHRNAGSDYIRAWLDHLWYADWKSYPLKADGSYDWNVLDQFMDTILAVGAKPMVLFAHGDICGNAHQSPAPFDFSSCEAYGTVPPSDFNAFGDYVATVTQHLVNRYGFAEVNTWYFEIMNEPFGFSNWDPDYYNLYNIAEARIKAIVPGAKVGGYNYRGTTAFINQCSPDFIDLHLYPNNLAGISNDQDRMDTIDNLYWKIKNTVDDAGNVEVISGEYNIDIALGPYDNMGRPFAGSYYVAALINEIKAGATMELVYNAGCSHPDNDGCIGMWHIDGSTFDNYKKKTVFTKNHPRGSTIYYTQDNDVFDMIATNTNGKRYVTIVNKQGTAQTMTLQVVNVDSTMKNVQNQAEAYAVNGGTVSISFSGFETKFFEVGEGSVPDSSYNSFITALNSYLNGQSFQTFVNNANNWVSS